MAAREGDTGSKRKAEEDCSQEAADDQKVDKTVDGEAAADLNEAVASANVDDECPDDDDDDDPVIRNLNLMSARNLMTPEWIENKMRLHYEDIALYNRVYDALENGEIESDSDSDEAAAADRRESIWVGVDLSGLNIVGDESRGMDAVAVYPAGLDPEEKAACQVQDQDPVLSSIARENPRSRVQCAAVFLLRYLVKTRVSGTCPPPIKRLGCSRVTYRLFQCLMQTYTIYRIKTVRSFS
jgi:hypothetical protein